MLHASCSSARITLPTCSPFCWLAANVHYITGKTFSSWVRESGLQAGEQIRMRKEGGRVVIQRVPSSKKASRAGAVWWSGEVFARNHEVGGINRQMTMLPCSSRKVACSVPQSTSPSMSLSLTLSTLLQVRVDFTTKAASRSASLAGAADAAVAGAPATHGHELASPPPADALEAMEALAAAAGYAGMHGTPAIQAALAGSDAVAAAIAAGLPSPGGAAAAVQASKRQRTGQPDVGMSAAEFLLQQEQAVLASRRAGTSGLPGSSASVEGMRMFKEINHILAQHMWSPEEQMELLRFRWGGGV